MTKFGEVERPIDVSVPTTVVLDPTQEFEIEDGRMGGKVYTFVVYTEKDGRRKKSLLKGGARLYDALLEVIDKQKTNKLLKIRVQRQGEGTAVTWNVEQVK